MWNGDLVRQMTDGVKRVMKHLGMLDRSVATAPATDPEFVTMWVPTAPVMGSGTRCTRWGAEVAEGQALGEIRDEFGKVLATITSEKAGKIVYRLTSLAVNQGEALLGVDTPLNA